MNVIARRTVAVLSAAMIGTLSFQTAHADEVEAADPGLTVAELRTAAEEAGPEAEEAVDAMLATTQPTGSSSSSAEEESPEELTASRGDSSEKRKFWTPALAVGCGVGKLPVTGSFATVQGGPNYGAGPVIGKNNLIQPYIPSGHAFFHVFTVDEKLAPAVDGTTVSVAWLNLRTFKGGIEQLDDTVLGVGVNSQTSKLVHTGKGPIIAAIAGKVAYRGGDTCTVLPVVGSTTVE